MQTANAHEFEISNLKFEIGETIYRLRLADLRAQELDRPPGYILAVMAAGVADADGIHWRIPFETLRQIWSAYGINEGRGCEGCGR
jgi:hypothetical protein